MDMELQETMGFEDPGVYQQAAEQGRGCVAARATVALALVAVLVFAVVSCGREREDVEQIAGEPAPVAVSERRVTPPPEPTFAPPARLRIPRISVDAPVVAVGVTPEGAMASPERREDTGWFDRGPHPGERGSAVIAGHSGYRSGHAVFDELGQVQIGDPIYVVDKEGATIEFRVRETRYYRPGDSPAEVFSRADGAHLNLVTCTGAWDSSAGTHSQRLVVFADAVRN